MANNKIDFHNLHNNYTKMSQSSLEKLIEFLDHSYYLGDSAKISDSLYDEIRDYYYELTGKNKSSAHSSIPVEHINNKVKLPTYMGSMDKLKPGYSKLTSFLNNYTNDKVISSKLDGNSLLIGNDGNTVKAYTRGNGTEGRR